MGLHTNTNRQYLSKFRKNSAALISFGDTARILRPHILIRFQLVMCYAKHLIHFPIPLPATASENNSLRDQSYSVGQLLRLSIASERTHISSNIKDAPTQAVPPEASNGGETSTRSAPTRLSPCNNLIDFCASKVFGPPISGVPVPGA